MGFNGSGTFIRNDGTLTGSNIIVTQAANGIGIQATRYDNEFNEIASALGKCATLNGETGGFTSNINANNNKIVNLAAPSADGDALRWQNFSWTGWTPTINTSPTSGYTASPTITNARYIRINKAVMFFVEVLFTINEGTTVDSITFTLPVSPSKTSVCHAATAHTGGAVTVGHCEIALSGVGQVFTQNRDNWTSGSNKKIIAQGFYEVS